MKVVIDLKEVNNPGRILWSIWVEAYERNLAEGQTMDALSWDSMEECEREAWNVLACKLEESKA